ncbi:MAG: hypothetical protein DHS20C20_18620 [Ardenticatenaceae bacterium]|nr:MAG: hypothetical protein DHS20C20_18620 [Ardenticatenaceae bacterium]
MSRAKMALLLCLISLITLATNFVGNFQIANAIPTAEEYVFRRSWGAEGDKILLAGGRGDIAVGSDGVIYVANPELHRITLFSPTDRTFRTFGNLGDGDGQFSYPSSLTVDNEGNVFIVDFGNGRIQKLNNQGEYITQWNKNGRNLAVNSNGQLYLVDNTNHLVFKYDNNGQYLSEWGGQGNGSGQFEAPQGIAVDVQSGNIYVADTGNDRVQKFAANGSYLAQWGSSGSGAGQFNSPADIAVDGNGNVYVADDGRIQIFTSGGVFSKQCILESEFSYGFSFTVDANGSMYLLAGDWLGYIYKFNNNCELEATWGNHVSGSWEFLQLQDIAVDSLGRVFVNDGTGWSIPIHVFDISGSHLATWGNWGGPGDIATDTDSNIYQVDGEAQLVQKYSSDGTTITELENFDLFYPGAVAVDNGGAIYVGQSSFPPYDQVVKLNSNGATISIWGETGSDPGQFSFITGIATDTDNNIYVVDLNPRVQKFTEHGTFLNMWGTLGSSAGQFSYPESIAIDNLNNVYVADSGNNRIQKFTSEGAFVTQWGEYGTEDGQFLKPYGVDVDVEGNVYVIERDIFRVQVFSLGYPIPDPVSGLILNGSFVNSMNLNEWAYGGSLPMTTSSNRASLGNSALLLGEETGQVPQDEGIGWVHQTIYVDPAWERPVLSFDYKMFVNDTIDFSDFFVAIQDGSGRNHLATVLRDGFQSCFGNVLPPPKTELEWRSFSYDLSQYKGQNIRLFFSNRNLHDGASLGIWTYVDDVRVLDAGALPSGGPLSVYLPIVLNNYETSQDCDPVSYSSWNANDSLYLRFASEN